MLLMAVMKIHNNRYTFQNGGALIILVFILVLALSAVMFSVLDGRGVKVERDKTNSVILANAKMALIGYAIGVIGGGQRPGDLIRPDAASEIIGDYDGTADASCLDTTKVNGLPMVTGGSGVNMRCLGRLPWKDLGMSITGSSESDSTGVMPWYAVSGNLVDPTCLKVLNSNTLNLVNIPPPAPLDCTGITLPYPWLNVRDSNGNVISNRVAAVIFIPGGVRGTQARPISPNLAASNQYLDKLVVPAGCATPCVPGTYGNADMKNDFIFASEGMPNATANDFNDQLVYITIDELMAAVEKRVAQEARSQLRSYYLASNGVPANRFYPYAAGLGDSNNACVNLKQSGLLPIMPAQATCTSATSCNVSFPMTKVNFSLTAGAYTSKSGSCNKVGNICSCNGAGSCVKSGAGGSNLTCNAGGSCSSAGVSPSGNFVFTYTPKAPDVTSTSGACLGAAGSVTCTAVGTFSSPPTTCTHPNLGLANLPQWFTDNSWQDFMYYAISSDCNYVTPGCAIGYLTVGAKANNYALVISTGQKLATQVRPSSLIYDYLDSPSLPPYGTTAFDAVGTPRSSTYNDQMFIVAP